MDQAANMDPFTRDPIAYREQEYYLVLFRELKQMFGPAPVLSSESVAGYNKMLFRLLEAMRPRDFMERILIKQGADATWEVIRYARLKSEHMQLKFRQLAELEQHAGSEHSKPVPEHAGAQAGQSTQSAAAQGAMPAAGGVAGAQDNAAASVKSPTFADHAQALEHGIDHVERLEKLLKGAVARRNDILGQIERYRNNLGGFNRIDYHGLIAYEFACAGVKDPWPYPPGYRDPVSPEEETTKIGSGASSSDPKSVSDKNAGPGSCDGGSK